MCYANCTRTFKFILINGHFVFKRLARLPLPFPRQLELQVGVLCKRGGVYSVVEYSEMDAATAERRDPATGALVFNAGNLCIHYYSTAFLATECSPERLPKVHHSPPVTSTPYTPIHCNACCCTC